MKQDEAVLINQVVSIMNPASGYLYDPAGASPRAEVRKVFSRSAGVGGFACGPNLEYLRGSVEVKSDKTIHEERFDTKLLADGWMLLKTGPRADYTDFADWSRATYYSKSENPGHLWTATSYCLNRHNYQPCGRSENATPPDPLVVKDLR